MIATQYAELEDTDFAAQIDRLLDSISRGATVTITKQRQPVARVVAADDEAQRGGAGNPCIAQKKFHRRA